MKPLKLVSDESRRRMLSENISKLAERDADIRIAEEVIKTCRKMIDFKDIEGIYFVGIGGIGMSALALYFIKGRL